MINYLALLKKRFMTKQSKNSCNITSNKPTYKTKHLLKHLFNAHSTLYHCKGIKKLNFAKENATESVIFFSLKKIKEYENTSTRNTGVFFEFHFDVVKRI